MPTAAKLIAAVAFAIVGWLAARAYIPQLPESTSTGYFPEMMAALGFAIGWLTLGPAVGRGYVEAISLGLRTSIFLVFWGLLLFSLYFMVIKSTRQSYGNAGDAVLDVPMLMLHYGQLMGAATLITTLVVGGALGGIVAEFAGRRWR